MTGLRTRAAAPRTVARAPRTSAAPPRPPHPTDDLAAAAQAAGADVHSGPDFMEISFPPPAGAAPATIARSPTATPQSAGHPAANAPRPPSAGGAVLARATVDGGSGSSSGGSAGDSVVEAVLRALREENEHLGVIDGIDPLF
jgi:hypothetical protein